MKLWSPCGMLPKSMQFDKTLLYTAMRLVLLNQPDPNLSSSNVCSVWMQDQKVGMTTQFLLPLPTRNSEANLTLKQQQRGEMGCQQRVESEQRKSLCDPNKWVMPE